MRELRRVRLDFRKMNDSRFVASKADDLSRYPESGRDRRMADLQGWKGVWGCSLKMSRVGLQKQRMLSKVWR